MKLTHKSYFEPPPSLFIQKPENRLYLPKILFSKFKPDKTSNISNTLKCQYTKSGMNSIDSNGNICKLQDIDNSGCCIRNIVNNTFSSKECEPETQRKSNVYELFNNDKCECFSSYIGCISICLINFVGKSFDKSIQEKYSFDSCNYICRTSSSSTIKSRYYIDDEYKYCYGNSYYPSTQYSILALLHPSYKFILTESDKNCASTCKKLNKNSYCSPLSSIIFRDDCKYHEIMTSNKCQQCRIANNAAAIQNYNQSNQICYRSSELTTNVCDFKPYDESQQNICLCSLS